MERLDYDRLIQIRIEKNIDRVLPIVSVIAMLSAVAIYFGEIPVRFAYFDFGIGLVFMYLYRQREQIKTDTKVLLIVITAVLIGGLSFLDGGFDSAGVTLFMMANVMSVLLLPKMKSVVVSAGTVLFLAVTWTCGYMGYLRFSLSAGRTEWVIQLLMYVLYIILLHTAVFALRNYLLENIERLEDSVELTYHMAYYDHLTDLPNQMLFKDQIDKKIDGNASESSIIILNVRNLRVINTIFSEDMGDKLLLQIGRFMEGLVGDDELLARVSGNEFAIWTPISEHSINQRIQSILNNFDLHFQMAEMTKKVDFYVGTGSSEAGDCTAGELYHRAAMAISYVKKHRLSKVMNYNVTIEDSVVEEEHMLDSVKKAVRNRDFTVFYQAKVDGKDGGVVGVEALARWEIKPGQFISPAVFVPMIEELDLAQAFGRIILEKSLADYEALEKKYGAGITLSINTSPSQLVEQSFIKELEEQVAAAGVNPEVLIIEVTEEIMIEGVAFVNGLIGELKKMGVKVSLDDFGSGYSSLNYLMQLDIDELKIDKTFVDQLSNHKSKALLEMIVGLSKAYDLSLVVEGVETKEQFMQLLVMECHVIQGFYFSRPEPVERE